MQVRVVVLVCFPPELHAGGLYGLRAGDRRPTGRFNFLGTFYKTSYLLLCH